MEQKPPVDIVPKLDASVIISTYNRCDALIQTLTALGRQSVSPDKYEIVVVDDGSSDNTYSAAIMVQLPCRLKVFRHTENRGVSAGRNLAICNASGKTLILLSDDLLVPPNFIQLHLETLERFPGWWVVAGYKQLPTMGETPFGRYLIRLEESYGQVQSSKPMGVDLWEREFPTARNLSLRKNDLDLIGLFDEQFCTTCEDQDLAHRAMDIGIRFLYNASIICLHNDQVADLKRYCMFQYRGAHDTALFCHKHASIHGAAPIAILNGYPSWNDRPRLLLRKLLKAALSWSPVTTLLFQMTNCAERLPFPDRILAQLYSLIIGLYMFRGYRQGLDSLSGKGATR